VVSAGTAFSPQGETWWNHKFLLAWSGNYGSTLSISSTPT